MKDERIIEEMTRLEFGRVKSGSITYDGCSMPYVIGVDARGRTHNVASYLNNHNACQRVIDGMDEDHMCIYSELLSFVMGFALITWRDCKATARHKCEAILMSYGKWAED